MPEPPRWRVVVPRALVLRAWEDELVIYNESTGHTHLLGVVPGKLLQMLLEDGGQSVVSLIHSAKASPEWRAPGAISEIEFALSEMARLKLVAQDPP
jgi:hypothetical protein